MDVSFKICDGFRGRLLKKPKIPLESVFFTLSVFVEDFFSATIFFLIHKNTLKLKKSHCQSDLFWPKILLLINNYNLFFGEREKKGYNYNLLPHSLVLFLGR